MYECVCGVIFFFIINFFLILGLTWGSMRCIASERWRGRWWRAQGRQPRQGWRWCPCCCVTPTTTLNPSPSLYTSSTTRTRWVSAIFQSEINNEKICLPSSSLFGYQAFFQQGLLFKFVCIQKLSLFSTYSACSQGMYLRDLYQSYRISHLSVGLVSAVGMRIGSVIERSLVQNLDWTMTIFWAPLPSTGSLVSV
jgi:hypothetical protein